MHHLPRLRPGLFFCPAAVGGPLNVKILDVKTGLNATFAANLHADLRNRGDDEMVVLLLVVVVVAVAVAAS